MDQHLTNLFHDFADPNDDLPPELLLDPEHPDNDRYFDALAHIKRAVMDAQQRLRPLQRHAVMLHRQGLKNTEIAKKLDLNDNTIGKYINSPEAQRLMRVMDHHQHQLDGPNFEHRKAILYRIALEQEKKQPKTTITAIQEINKMSGVYQDGPGSGGVHNEINIQINGELLPRGPLDQMPETYETRLANQSNVIEGDFHPIG